MARSKQEVISEMVDSGLFSDDEIRSAVKQAPTPQRGMMGKAWDALAIPERKSREGLKMLAGMVPTPQPAGRTGAIEEGIRQQFPLLNDIGPQRGVIQDVAMGTPKVAADTMAEAAPSFISRPSLLMMGAGLAGKALKPAIRPILQGLGRQGESLSGAMPGSLEAAYKDSGLMFGEGRKAAGQAYEAAKAGEKIQYGENLTPARKFFNQAYQKAVAGTLKPIEALEARKVADDLYESGSYVGDEILQKRAVLDKVAKQAFEAADTGFKRALQSESLRNILPQNKYGGTSAFKMGIMTALKAMGGAGKVASMAISPAVQGLAATGAGVVARQGMPIGQVIAAALNARRNQNAQR